MSDYVRLDKSGSITHLGYFWEFQMQTKRHGQVHASLRDYIFEVSILQQLSNLDNVSSTNHI
jgi:hypothetical protein